MLYSAEKYVGAVDAAIDNAVTINPEKGTLRPNEVSVLFNLDDDQEISYNFPESVPETRPYEVFVAMDELPFLADAVHQVMVKRGLVSCDDSLKRNVKHEQEHDTLARHLGAQASLGGVAFAYVPAKEGLTLGHQFFHRPLNLSTTKLGLALMTAYPERLSLGDVNTLDEMGYPSVTGLIRRIAAHNERPGVKELPLPLSAARYSGL